MYVCTVDGELYVHDIHDITYIHVHMSYMHTCHVINMNVYTHIVTMHRRYNIIYLIYIISKTHVFMFSYIMYLTLVENEYTWEVGV